MESINNYIIKELQDIATNRGLDFTKYKSKQSLYNALCKKQNNPSAFPSSSHVAENSGDKSQVHGMTLRDYFAAKAMQGMINAIYVENESVPPKEILERFKLITVNSYWFADEMLKQRDK